MRLFLKDGWYSGRNKWGKLRVNQGKKVRLRKGMGRGRKKERDKCEENGVVIISVYNERFYNFILQFSPGIKHLKIL